MNLNCQIIVAEIITVAIKQNELNNSNIKKKKCQYIGSWIKIRSENNGRLLMAAYFFYLNRK